MDRELAPHQRRVFCLFGQLLKPITRGSYGTRASAFTIKMRDPNAPLDEKLVNGAEDGDFDAVAGALKQGAFVDSKKKGTRLFITRRVMVGTR